MITPPSTENSILPIEEMIKEKKELEKVFVEPSRVLKTSLAYRPPWVFLTRKSEEEIYKQLHSFKEIIESAEETVRTETLTTYPALELGALEQLYTFRRKSEVINFLVNNYADQSNMVVIVGDFVPPHVTRDLAEATLAFFRDIRADKVITLLEAPVPKNNLKEK